MEVVGNENSELFELEGFGHSMVYPSLPILMYKVNQISKKILDKNNIVAKVQPSTVDEYPIKKSLLREKASPETISKNLAEIKAIKVSQKNFNILVLGADSVIDLNGELISKPENRGEALGILKKLDGKEQA